MPVLAYHEFALTKAHLRSCQLSPIALRVPQQGRTNAEPPLLAHRGPRAGRLQ